MDFESLGGRPARTVSLTDVMAVFKVNVVSFTRHTTPSRTTGSLLMATGRPIEPTSGRRVGADRNS
jgi:hypothetical protein